jgi:hypothetical protein
LLPTNFLAVAREHQNVEGIQFPHRSRGNEHSVLIVNAKGVRIDSSDVTSIIWGSSNWSDELDVRPSRERFRFGVSAISNFSFSRFLK